MQVNSIHQKTQGLLYGKPATRPQVIDEIWAAEQCRIALRHLERAVKGGPLQLGSEAGSAVEILASLQQECMIGFHEEESNWITCREHNLAILEEVQNLLSLAMDPQISTRRKSIQMAIDRLQKLMVDGWH